MKFALEFNGVVSGCGGPWRPLTGHDTPTRAKCTGSNHLPLQLYRGGQVRLR